MENNDEQKCSSNEASASVNCQSNMHDNAEDEGSSRQGIPNMMVSGLTGTSPQKFVSLEEIIKVAHGMKKMALAHEIAVDKRFQLQKREPDDGTFPRRVKEIVHKAFWDSLTEELAEDPPKYRQALALLKEIKESLDELVLPHHSKIRENIREVLDFDLIKQQAEKGVLDFHHYAQYIISIMAKVCAPIRDEKIRELSEKVDVIEIFKDIMELLELMRMDLVNFTITMMRPNIVASSIEYEKAKFAEFLKVTSGGLQFTEAWLLRHLEYEKIPEPCDANAIRRITNHLLTEAYLDLLEWDFNPDAETLMLDQGRLIELRDQTCKLNIIGSVILIVNNTVGASVQGVSTLKKNIKDHMTVLLDSTHSNKDLEIAVPNIALQVKKDVQMTLQEIGAPDLSQSMEALLEGQIQDLATPDHKIRHLVSLRIRQFLQKILVSQSTASQQVSPGLSALQQELTDIAAQFLILIAQNRSVFWEYYEEIVAGAVAKRAVDNKNTNVDHPMEM